MTTIPTIPNNQAAADTQEQEAIPVSEHGPSGFCYKPNCSCKTDPFLIHTLVGQVRRGTISVDDMSQIYHGKTI